MKKQEVGFVNLGKCRRLTDAEVREYTSQMKDGSTEARNRLVESVLPLMKDLCSRCQRPWITPDDLFQEACVMFLKNIHRFDPDKGKLTTFVGRNVIWATDRVRKINRRLPGHFSIGAAPRNAQTTESGSYHEPKTMDVPRDYNTDDAIDGRMLQERLATDRANLSETRKRVVDLRLAGWLFKDIGEEMGMTKSGAQNHFSRVIDRWRGQIGVRV